MTGNTSKWRAPLAGLASVAMLATMGVAASTANAASSVPSTVPAFGSVVKSGKYEIKVYDAAKPYDGASAYNFWKYYGEALRSSDIDSYAGSHKVLDYLSFDKDGNNKVSTPYVVTGDVKLYAHFKDAVKVTFDKDGNPKTTAGNTTITIAKGTGLTADEYAEIGGDSFAAPKSGYEFAGWTTEGTLDSSSSDALYTGAALNGDTVLYARYAKYDSSVPSVNTGKDLAKVDFYKSVNDTAPITGDFYTLNGYAFPEFRAPFAAGSWKVKGNLEGADYDFSTPVKNDDDNAGTTDTTLYNVTSAGAQNVTVKFDPRTAKYTPDDIKTTSDQTIAEPTAPVRAGYVFTGWYTSPAYGNPNAVKYDFSKTVAGNFSNPTRTVTLYAGWDDVNVSALLFNLDYWDWAGNPAQQVLFVNPAESVTLPNGWEEYFQTTAQQNAAKGEYTAKKLTGWYVGVDKSNTVTKFTAGKALNVTAFTAKWTGASSIKLVANGGKFDGNTTVKWVTKEDGQKWADVVVKPSQDGYDFLQWRNDDATTYAQKDDGTVVSKGEGQLIANLSDGYWYTIKNGNEKDAKFGKILSGSALKAEWKQSAVGGIEGYRNQFKLQFGNKNQASDALTVAAYGYTDASAKAYVAAVNALEDEYAAYNALPEGQDKIDAAKALAAKYEAAQGLLVKSNGADVPDGKVAVYRAFNPNETRGGSHLYTTSFAEYSSVVRAGWKAEGVQFQTTSSKKAEPVYRAYNPNDGSHFYTLSQVEFNHVIKAGWKDEGVAWYVAKDASESVLRIYNPNSGEHVFTLSKAEVNHAVKAGWNDEGVAFKAYAK
ncbi:InlB B-repeat-containing protein [Bifidobacterium sp. MA2]|uniref:InlB B-repeat-containing protein n=1 Tax=Bifidobacterium santillanense TaxID=2809028 RepID=A0ABS5UP98_9BIFI|nr:InlB B-repeat-containing protein [Bifidobacterium santillanense]MBT1172699.1 InlB B-repeat-containing protein [Bifidobacterium santillanense]